jgi:hypothetical protein
MKLTCIYEDPDGNAVARPSSDFISEVFNRPIEFWQGGGNGDSSIKHVVLDPSENTKAVYRRRGPDGVFYALIDTAHALVMKQPLPGRFFMMTDDQCAVDPTQQGETIVDESCGDPFPIDPVFTVDLPTARSIAHYFAEAARPLPGCEWRDLSSMNVDWEAYV